MLDGITLSLGGRALVVPPLNLKALRKLAPKIKIAAAITEDLTDEQIDAVVEIVHAAVARNYPDMTKETLEDLLDLGNMKPTIDAVMGASGLKRGAPGEAQEPSSTGPASTGS